MRTFVKKRKMAIESTPGKHQEGNFARYSQIKTIRAALLNSFIKQIGLATVQVKPQLVTALYFAMPQLRSTDRWLKEEQQDGFYGQSPKINFHNFLLLTNLSVEFTQ